ncbi:3',5'-cyclic adenosine monophosphate phosphodiesterase CpdA [Clarias magur]|uniref:3',5'-cyclic adenosine monophosphate phosphodiesterase CpdA n=1 Tax=Clarias magur TaxID=1594786 RepID=A0A8J4UNI6_CLAMG|nr:3',5'-cyclic adenosine monophosphate phosphodiesterase CpdA [Clarias magur]
MWERCSAYVWGGTHPSHRSVGAEWVRVLAEGAGIASENVFREEMEAFVEERKSPCKFLALVVKRSANLSRYELRPEA